ncbi:MAG: fibronectin type III domain-containing protein [Candidatus Omnitrophica bacterium]|nr:fibronectin type III domain-containing protein [Candidatus Omnitrophota bacterium]
MNWGAVAGATSYKIYYGTATGIYGTPRNAGNVTSYTLTGLSAGKIYYIAVSAVNAGIEGEKSTEVTALTVPASPPFSLTPGNKQIKISWTAVTGAAAYRVYYGTSAGVYGTPVDVTDATSYILTGLDAATTYYVILSANNASGEGPKSVEKSAVTYPNPPTAPEFNSAAGGTSQAVLNWNSTAGATSYKIYYGTAPGTYGTPKNAGNVTSYTITGLSAGKTYYFAISGTNLGGEGPKSVELSALTAPSAPSISLVGGNKQIKVSWGAVTTATSYNVYYGTASGIYGPAVNVSGTTYTITGLDAASVYYVTMSAVNDSGEGKKTAEKNVTTFPNPPTGSPTLSSVTGGIKQVTLNWEGITDATSYKIYYGTAPGTYGTPKTAGNVTTYTLTGLSAGKTYYFAISGANPGGEGPKSGELSALTAPSAPTITLVTGDKQVKVSWGAISTATSYNIYYGTASGIYGHPVNVGNVKTYTVTGLDAATTYYFVVSANNASGEGARSVEKNATTLLPPPPTTPTLNSALGGANQVELNWDAVSGATSYRIYYGTAPGVYGAPIDVVNLTTYTVTGLDAGTAYYFAVSAVNAGGESPKSDEKSATTLNAFTEVSGVISSNTTWTLSHSPYLVTGDITVNNGVILTIEPGVIIKFNGSYLIDGQGVILAQGTAQSPIVFTSNKPAPAANDWKYITVRKAASVFDHVVVEYSTNGLYVPSSSSNPAQITNSVFSHNYYGIYFEPGTGPNIANNSITENVRGIFAGCNIYTGCHPTINNNSIFGNTQYAIYTDSYGTNASGYTINAQKNWWGTNIPTGIDAVIWDKKDNASLALVDYGDFLQNDPAHVIIFSNVFATSQFFDPTSESTQIHYTIDKNADITLKIYEFDTAAFSNTNLVKTIHSPGRLPGANTAEWNGKNEAGADLPPGVYAFTIDGNNAEGSEGHYDQNHFARTDVGVSNVTLTPSGSFSPVKGERLEVRYDLESPALVSLAYLSNNFITQQPRNTTGNVDDWDGRDAAGNIVVSPTPVTVNARAEKLPENCIVIKKNTLLDIPNLTTDPYVIRPLYNEVTRITYSISGNANVTVKILSPDGNSNIRTLEENAAKSAGTYHLDWDGKNSDGNTIAEQGDYRVRVEANGASGSVSVRVGNIRILY